MPGKQVKDWDRYHALRRRQGMSKQRAAMIANGLKKKNK